MIPLCAIEVHAHAKGLQYRQDAARAAGATRTRKRQGDLHGWQLICEIGLSSSKSQPKLTAETVTAAVQARGSLVLER
jgi:hypothetical protein